MLRLDGKTAIITGGVRGQGLATVELFAKQGAHVVTVDNVADAAEVAAVEALGVTFVAADVSNEGDWAKIVAAALAFTGTIDILVNNAAITHSQPMEETTKARLDQVLAVNLVGPYLGMQAVLGSMLAAGKGSIINVSSVNGLRGSAGMTAYDASKWGLRGMTKSAALEYAARGIRVNSVHPGAIDTPMLNPTGGDTTIFAERLRIGFGRVGRPIEVAHASLFLASDEASYISGAELAVDGTWSTGVYLGDVPAVEGAAA